MSSISKSETTTTKQADTLRSSASLGNLLANHLIASAQNINFHELYAAFQEDEEDDDSDDDEE